ncbi:MAG: ABC transporter substrate-binding protein [Treponema sp.]|nr:ABC transporter substrate-binding protein [Treponema sp.]
MFKKNIAAFVLGLGILLLFFSACGAKSETSANQQSARPGVDREGLAIILPEKINRIISIGPSNTEILIGLGLANRIIAVDIYSADTAGLAPNTPAELDMMALNAELIVSYMPDIIFITGIARGGTGDNPLAPVSAAGISVIYMPTSGNVAAIMEDIRFIASVMEAREAGETLVSGMQAEIDKVSDISKTITEKRTVYFEISPAPWMYSFGTGTFLNEMIELTGAENIFKNQTGWLSISDEALLSANPDVILTTTDFLDDPIGEIMGRPGFGVIAAVQNGDVYMIDANSSSRPSQNIIKALREIAKAVYPEYYR